MPLELIILIGLQASGKSTFARLNFPDFIHVSKDAMPNVKNKNRRQENLIREALAAGNSVVVDNTNPSIDDRMYLLTIGKDCNAQITGYYFSSQIKDCIERNRNRDGRACVPDVAMYATLHKLEQPSYDEGFDELYFVEMGSESTSFTIKEWQQESTDGTE